MIDRGPGILVVSFGSWLTPFPPLPLSLFLSLLSPPVCRWSSLLMGRGGGVGEDPNDKTMRKPGHL